MTLAAKHRCLWAALVSLRSRFSQLGAHLFCCLPSFLPFGRGHVSGVSLGAVLRVRRCPLWCCRLWNCRVMEVLHVVYSSTLVRDKHEVSLRPLSSVTLTFLATSGYRASSMCFVRLIHCLCTFCSQELLLCFGFSGCNITKGSKASTHSSEYG